MVVYCRETPAYVVGVALVDNQPRCGYTYYTSGTGGLLDVFTMKAIGWKLWESFTCTVWSVREPDITDREDWDSWYRLYDLIKVPIYNSVWVTAGSRINANVYGGIK